jgi:hypothetical protein
MATNRERFESTAERAGIGDQQDAELEKMGDAADAGSRRAEPESTPDREGIVDQQGALIEKQPPPA